jgi:predicted NBD/HSP70 family sugar kinase
VLGIDFGGTKVALAIAGLDGRFLATERLATRGERGATQAVERALSRGRALVAATARETGGRCVAVGAVSPGIVLRDRILLAPNVPGWEELALHALLRDGLELDAVIVSNDVKAAALAEARRGALRDVDPGLLVVLGTGVAAGIVIGGRVVDGAAGGAGEIGYGLTGRLGEAGAAAGRAPLEELAGGRAIGERGSRLLGRPLSAAEVFASPDPRARRLVDEALAQLAVHVANLAIALDPARIALAGGLMASADRVLGPLAARLASAAPFPPELVPAAFVHDGPLRGATTLALDVLAPRAPGAVTA